MDENMKWSICNSEGGQKVCVICIPKELLEIANLWIEIPLCFLCNFETLGKFQ